MMLASCTKEIFKQYKITVFLFTLISILFFSLGAVPESLYFNQTAISNGEYWRLITAHLVHSDLEHLIWNLCALVIISSLIEQKNRVLLLLSIVISIITIDYYLWFNSIEIINYAGFSGVLNTLLVITLFQQWQNHKACRIININIIIHQLPVIIYSISAIKIIVELLSQQAIFSHTTWLAVPQVHLVGFIAGTIVATLIYLSNWIKLSINECDPPSPLCKNDSF